MSARLRTAAAAAALAAVAALVLSTRDSETAATAPVAGTPEAASRAGSHRPALTSAATDAPGRWELGELRSYELDTLRVVEVYGQSTAVRVRGELDLAVVGLTDELVELRARIREPEVDVAGAQADVPAEQLAALTASVTEPFFATAGRDGQVRTVHLSPGTPSIASRIQRAVLADAQLVIPEDANESWDTVERDSSGRFRARYERRDDGTLIKRKVEYLGVASLAGESSAPVELDVTHAEALVTVDERDRLVSVTTDEQLAVDAGGGVEVSTAGSTTLVLIRVGRADALINSLARARVVASPVDVVAPTGNHDDNAAHARLVAGADLDDLLGELAEIPAGAAGRRARSTVMMRLSALIHLDPEVAEAALAAARDEPAETAGTIVGAVASADTPPAQRALADLTGDPEASPQLRAHAAAQLGLSSAPTDDAIASMRDHLDGDDALADVAALAVANMARNTGDAETADEIIANLLARLGRAEQRTRRVLYLQALGNAGNPAALPAIAAALDDAVPAIRAAAAEALRFIPGARAVTLLRDAMTADASQAVRERAIWASTYRDVAEMLPGLAAVITADASPELRGRAMKHLARHIAEYATIAELLAQVAAADPDPDLRSAARDYLAHS